MTTLLQDYNTGDTEVVIDTSSDISRMGIVKIGTTVLQYVDTRIANGDEIHLLAAAYVYGDNVSYPAGTFVDVSPDMEIAVNDVITSSNSWEWKVQTQPKLFCMNDTLKHWQLWEPVIDEETGEDTGKRINPDTQEEVQFDMELMNEQTSHYYEYYNRYARAIPRGA